MPHMTTQEEIEFTIRSAMPSDYPLCVELDHTVSTDFVWQMILNTSDGGQQVTFRQARLPRSMKVMYPREDDTLLASWQLHGTFLVAEWEDQVVGYINARQEASQEAAWVADLVVDPAHWVLFTQCGTAVGHEPEPAPPYR